MPGNGFGSAAKMAAIGAAIGAVICYAAPAAANPVLLFEPETGQVLYAEEPDRAWHPASVTKLMTAYLTFEAVKAGMLAWDDDVPLSEHARSQPATRIGLRGGIKLNVEQAVRGLILRSANDFATALAERVAGSEEKFAEAMNATAKRLGMTRTVFRNPHGLPDPDQVTTARDLAILTTALLKDFPDRAEVFATPTVKIHKGTFHSQNDLLRTLFGADGMKTGFTCASGYNVVASATRDGHRLVAVVLGAVNRQKRSERATELLEAGFAHLAGRGVATSEAAHGAPRAVKTSLSGGEAQPGPISIAPVALGALAMAPVDPIAPEDIGRKVRSGKCRGYGGFAKKLPEAETSEADLDGEAAAVVTGSVTSVAPADPKPAEVVAAKIVAPKPKAAPTAARKSASLKKPSPAKADDAPAEASHGDGN